MRKMFSLCRLLLIILFLTSLSENSLGQFMPDVKEFEFECDGKKILKKSVEIPITSKGEIRIMIDWKGDAEKIDANLYTFETERLLINKIGTSPLELRHYFSEFPII